MKRLLDVILDTVKGRRDRAIILTLVLTGRRRTEVIDLKAGNISFDADTAFYTYRGKGGKKGRRELPVPALEAIRRTLSDIGKNLSTMEPDESLWQAGAGDRGVTSATFYNRFRRYLAEAGLPLSGVHILRHTAAKLRREVGESIYYFLVRMTVLVIETGADHHNLGLDQIHEGNGIRCVRTVMPGFQNIDVGEGSRI